MFKIGDYLVHRDHGICQIKSIQHIDYVDKDYFVMYGYNNDMTKIMVPCERVDEFCRELVSKDECLSLIDQIKDLDSDYIADNKKRKEECTRLLQSGHLIDLAHMMKMLFGFFEEKKANNKMIGTIDLSLFNEAKNKLYSEIQYVLNFNSFDEVDSFIKNRIEINS